jgi:hypothetical protein
MPKRRELHKEHVPNKRKTPPPQENQSQPAKKICKEQVVQPITDWSEYYIG